VSDEDLSEVIDGKSSWVDPKLDRNRVELDNEDLSEVADVSCVHDRNRVELDSEDPNEIVILCVHDRVVELARVARGGSLLDRAMTEGLRQDSVVRDDVGLDREVAEGVNHGAVVLDVVVAREVLVRLVLHKSARLTSAEVVPASRTPGSIARVKPMTV